MLFRDVKDHPLAKQVLFDLLAKRPPVANISHGAMPTWEQHCEFVDKHPYTIWTLILLDEMPIGSIYLTRRNEVGIQVVPTACGRGYGTFALQEFLCKIRASGNPGPFLANINPANAKSIAFFRKFGAVHLQNTYRFP